MKKGDLIVVYKICVGAIPDNEIKQYVNNIAEKFKFLKSENVIQYFIPVRYETEHPIEVIDTKNINTNVLSLLEELLKEVYYKKINS